MASYPPGDASVRPQADANWVPDPRAPGFAETCRAQALAIAKNDPASGDIMRFIDSVYAWPEV
jgi:Protein  of unknown function (DUF3018)